MFLQPLGKLKADEKFSNYSRSWIDEFLLGRVLENAFEKYGGEAGDAKFGVQVLKTLIGQRNWFDIKAGKHRKATLALEFWLNDPEVQRLMGVNLHDEILWFNQELMESWLWWMMLLAAIQILADENIPDNKIPEELLAVYDIVNKIRQNLVNSEFQIEKLLSLVKPKQGKN